MASRKYTAEQMSRAITDFSSGMSRTEAAAKHGIPYKTLYNKTTGISPQICRMGPSSYLSEDEELIIVEWIFSLAKRHIPVSKVQLFDSVQKIVLTDGRITPFKNGRPGDTWYQSFMSRHPEISERIPQNLTTSRESVTEHQIRNWFTEIKAYIESRCLQSVLDDPRRIYNADESAFYLQPSGGRVLTRRGEKNVYKSAGDEKENLTVLVTANAAGDMAPPMIVYNYERIPGHISQKIPAKWGIGRSESGWMCSSTFYEYICNVFYPWVLENSIPLPIIFFLDGHSSHLTLQLSEFCSEHQIEVIALFPNSTHLLQPMDLAVFRPLKLYWAQQCSEFKINNNGENVRKGDFPVLFQKSLELLSPDVIKNGFRAGGLFPFGPDYIDFSKLKQKNRMESHQQQVSNYTDSRFFYQLEKEVVTIFGEQKLNLFKKCYFIDRTQLHKHLPGEDVSLFTIWAKYRYGINLDNRHVGGSHFKYDHPLDSVQDEQEDPVIDVPTSNDAINFQTFKGHDEEQLDYNKETLALHAITSSVAVQSCILKDAKKNESQFFPERSIKLHVLDKATDSHLIDNQKENVMPLVKNISSQDDVSVQILQVKEGEKTPMKQDDKHTTFAHHLKITKDIVIPSPFKSALFWPGPEKDKKRRSKEKIPSAITSKAWQEYNRKKVEKKVQITEEKERKKAEREQKRIIKESKQKSQKEQKIIEKKNKKRRKLSSSSSSDDISDKEINYLESSDSIDFLDEDMLDFDTDLVDCKGKITIIDDTSVETVLDPETGFLNIVSVEPGPSGIQKNKRNKETDTEKQLSERQSRVVKKGMFVLAKFRSAKGKKTYHYVCKVVDVSGEKIIVQGYKSIKQCKDKFEIIKKDISIIEPADVIEILPNPVTQDDVCFFSKMINIKEI